MEKMDECSSSSSIDMEPTVFDRESASGINSGYNMDSAKEARDEVKEIERVSSKETTIIHAWRIFLMFFLFFTAMLVSSLTYFRLVGYEKSSYEIAVRYSPKVFGPINPCLLFSRSCATPPVFICFGEYWRGCDNAP